MNITLPQNVICGYFDCSIFGDLKQSPERVRTLYEIEYYLEDGKLTYSDGVAYSIRKGYIRIGVPGERCNSLLPFKTKYVKFSATGELSERMQHVPKYFKCRHPIEVETLFDELISLQASHEFDSVMFSGKLLVLLATVISDSKNAPSGSVKNDTVFKSKKYIEENIDKTVTLSDIAGFVNLSPNYFHTLFSDIEGITPREYITKYRLSLVCELLRTSSLSLSEISDRCGFCNQQYMSLLFKKSFGLSPRAYRRNSGKDYLI
ncbi:MAG: helix-turn-helix transcriptional regulator [Ruminococcaceae bacterium]|nr:helix-turn-helix transcriptional regulator [Oscillospiraceae bacterium]